MKNLAYIISASLLIFSSACSPGGSAAKGIKGIMKRSDYKGPCHKTMGCEGKALTLEMELANNNIMTSGNIIFARDPDNYEHTLRVEFDESVPIEVYSNIKDPANKRFVVTGVIEGYDQYVHEKCYRSWIIKVKDKKNVQVFTN